MKTDYKNYCVENYGKKYLELYSPKEIQIETDFQNGIISESSKEKKLNDLNAFAQKKSIMETTINAIKEYPDIKPSLIWKSIYEAHVHRYSGIDDSEIINNVISADQSWKKSSGHAFEEIIKLLSNKALSEKGIEIVLQKDLNVLINNNQLTNHERDIAWLKERIQENIFDLYAISVKNNRKDCFGCIQSKTSIRDRVTRDREPSINAMDKYFWSVAIVLDGEFLRNQKFINMVNGGSSEFEKNGWHGMYVFSEQNNDNRIYQTDINMLNFKEHAQEAAEQWKNQRQWLKNDWIAKTRL